ncbi:MAG: CDP-2,3-bis-(O-geranylgeranyl)-sn-glycerol synthase [Candidatus Micrarchaeia archaeon]|jgi:CDP-2,3-bis-(O-geranylgeranyl)-sn-glycerol synthase
MDVTTNWIISLILLILPAYFANAAPVYLNPSGDKAGKIKTTPIDNGKNFWDNRRLLGDGKTWEGLIGGVAAGWLFGTIMGWAGIIPLGFSFDKWFWVSLLLSMGAHAGDLLGSFIKRRLNVASGGPFPVFDQLGFVLLSLLFASFAAPEISYLIGVAGFAFLLALSYGAHVFFNWLAFKIGLKKVPW